MIIRIKNLKKKFGKKEILTGITATLNGNIYGILGPNGAGKTTLLRCIINLYEPTEGFVAFLDNSMQPFVLEGKNMGYLPQKFGIFKNFLVQDFMQYFSDLKEIPKSLKEESIMECLETVNMEDKRKVRVDKLSGGMIRRLGIAQALLGDPKVLIFDEPTAGLDPEERARFKSILAKIKKDKLILISTHIVEDVEAVCDQLLIMGGGNILTQSKPSELIHKVKDKVYLAAETDEIDGPYEVIRAIESEGSIMNRIICQKEQNLLKKKETLEDAYFAVVKGYHD